jgi:WD40 repeat protein
MISHAKSSKSNPIARWHVCQGSINAISFSPDGAYLATVGRDGTSFVPIVDGSLFLIEPTDSVLLIKITL